MIFILRCYINTCRRLVFLNHRKSFCCRRRRRMSLSKDFLDLSELFFGAKIGWMEQRGSKGWDYTLRSLINADFEDATQQSMAMQFRLRLITEFRRCFLLCQCRVASNSDLFWNVVQQFSQYYNIFQYRAIAL